METILNAVVYGVAFVIFAFLVSLGIIIFDVARETIKRK